MLDVDARQKLQLFESGVRFQRGNATMNAKWIPKLFLHNAGGVAIIVTEALQT